MTGAGLALIAGGLATLISFRSVLFGRAEGRGERVEGRGERVDSRGDRVDGRGERVDGRGVRGGEQGARRRSARAIEAPPRPTADEERESVPRGRRGRRRAMAAAPPGPRQSDEDDLGGLASIGLADEDEDEPFVPEAVFDEEIEEPEGEPEPVPVRADRYGDRVEGWVRPEYHDLPDEPRPGEYWTPIPVDLAGDHEPSAKGYGWPRPVERLPAVPDYEPATGFDLIPASEPTEVVPTWAVNDDRPGRVRLPRSWNTRNEKQPEKTERRKPRPRPRPRPEQSMDPSTVYVSRHAADPSPRRD